MLIATVLLKKRTKKRVRLVPPSIIKKPTSINNKQKKSLHDDATQRLQGYLKMPALINFYLLFL